MERFICVNGSDNLQIPDGVWRELNIAAPEQLHLEPQVIAAVSRRTAQAGWTRLPFCNTLCSEALGARPVLSQAGARVKEPPYQKPDQLPENLDVCVPRLGAMSRALKWLSEEGHRIAYNIEGPFSLLCTLLPMQRVFSTLRKPAGEEMLRRAEDWVSQYAGLAAEQGVKLFSFADPVATIDILGERMFRAVYVPCLKRVLHRLQEEHPGIPIHLCGKLTQCLLDTDTCTVKRWEPQTEVSTYGETLSLFCQTGEGGIVGHFCLNFLNTKRLYLELIEI